MNVNMKNLTVKQLQHICKKNNIKNYSNIKKDYLIEKINKKIENIKEIIDDIYYIMETNNHKVGGRKGRAEGLAFEDIVYKLLKNNVQTINNISNTLLNIIPDKFEIYKVSDLYKNFNNIVENEENINFKEFLQNYGPPQDDKRAADLIMLIEHENNVIKVGFDTKKPGSNAQWMAKSLNLLSADENILDSIYQYIEYNNKQRTWREKDEIEKDTICNDVYNFVLNNKKELKERFDDNPLYHCDYVVTTSNNNSIIKFIKVDYMLDNLFKSYKIPKKNICFGNYVDFKPHGSSKPTNLQFFLNKKIFNDEEYTTSIILN